MIDSLDVANKGFFKEHGFKQLLEVRSSRCSSTGSPFQGVKATAKMAQFLVDGFLASLSMANCRSIACKDPVVWIDLGEMRSDKS